MSVDILIQARYYLLLCLCSFLSGSCWGQGVTSSEKTHTYIEEYLRQRVDFGALDQEEATEQLNRIDYLLAHPLDINRIHLEDLQQIPSLSSYQAYQFINYRTNHANQFTSLYDLKLIPGWDEETIGCILPLFRYIPSEKKVSFSSLWEQGKSALGLFSSVSNNKKTDKPKQYLGNNLHWGLEWYWKSGEDLSAFVATEQDKGEPFRYRNHIGPDSYAFHLMIRSGWVRQLVLGDYRVRWGEGLVINQGYFNTRTSFSNQIPTSEGISSVTGWTESNKNRGFALSLGRETLNITLLGSLRRLDGNIRDGHIYALSEGGLHRTSKEWIQRNAVLFRQWGAKVSYTGGNLQLALQTLGYDWNGQLLAHPAGTLGNKRLEELPRHSNTSLSYHYHNTSGDFHLFGEVARSGLSAWATTHRLSYFSELWGMLNLSARYIGADYWSYYGMGHTHYSHTHNERGLMLDYRSPHLAGWEFRLFGDYFHTLKSRARGGGDGFRLSTQLLYGVNKPLSIRLLASIYNQPHFKRRSNFSSFLTYQRIPNWKVRMNLSLSQEQAEVKHRALSSLAYALSLGLEHQYQDWAKFALHTTIYRVPQGQQPIYLSTPRLNYDTQTIFLRGQGLRLYLLGKFRLGRHWHIGSSLSLLFPFGRDVASREQRLSLTLSYR